MPVRGSLSSNSVETIRAGVLAGLGIGRFTRMSLAEDFAQADVITVLDDFLDDVKDISLVWPRRRFIPASVRITTEFFTAALSKRS